MRFRPRPWPTAIALVGIAVLLALGVWQLHRRTWKAALLATIAARMDQPPADLPALVENPADWLFRPVRVTGRFDAGHAFYLYGRTFEGRAGIHLLVPLIRANAPAVLVDRGVVPFTAGSALEPYNPAPGDVTVEGIGRLPEPAGWFSPADRPADNQWYEVDLAAMSRVLGTTLAPVYVAAKPDGGTGWPRGTGGTEPLGIRNEHLNYAIFWFCLAAALAVIYVLSSLSRSSGTPVSDPVR